MSKREWVSRKWVTVSNIWILGSEPLDQIKDMLHVSEILAFVAAVGVTSLIYDLDATFWFSLGISIMLVWTVVRFAWGWYQEQHLSMVQKKKDWANVRNEKFMSIYNDVKALRVALIDEPGKDLQGTIDEQKEAKK